MTAIQLIILALAVTRLSLMFVTEDGPYQIFLKLRNWADIEQVTYQDGSKENLVINEETNLLGGILSCVWCSSVWFSAFILVFHLLFPITAFYVSVWLSLSMITIVIKTVIDKLKE